MKLGIRFHRSQKYKLYFQSIGPLAPTSQSQMSKTFRDSESVGKSNEKKWSQIGKLLLIKGVRSPRKKSFFLCADFALLSRFFVICVSHSI